MPPIWRLAPRPAWCWWSSRCRRGAIGRLPGIKRPIPICADESAHGLASLPGLAGTYDAVNIKLDKAGGLTEALAMAAAARGMGLGVHGRLHGGDVACHGAGRAAGADARASSISTGRCCSPATAIPACAMRDSLVYPAVPALWG